MAFHMNVRSFGLEIGKTCFGKTRMILGLNKSGLRS